MAVNRERGPSVRPIDCTPALIRYLCHNTNSVLEMVSGRYAVQMHLLTGTDLISY